MSEDVPGFQALPGATPENSAFIDLCFNPSVSLPGKSTVSIEINEWQLRLVVGVVVHCSMAFLTPKPRLRFAVQPGQVVPVFYRASILRGDPGALSIGQHRGMSRSEKGSLIFALVVLVSLLGGSLVMVWGIWSMGMFPQ